MQKRKSTTHKFVIVFLSVFALLLTACGGGNNSNSSSVSKASSDQQILTIPLSGYSDIKTLDPALATDASAITPINMIFTGLVDLDDHLQVHDELAQSHSVSADGLTWTFKLKPGLKFSDGTPLTSKDVAYSIDRALDPNLKSGVSPLYLGLIKDSDKRYSGQVKTLINDSILTPDDQTVILIANKKASYFLQTLTYQCSFVVEKSMIDKYGNNFGDHLNEGIGGDGPFKVSKYIHGREIDFVPNANYFGAKPLLKKVVMLLFKADDTTFKAYEANQVDSSGVPSQQLANARSLANNQFHQIPVLDVYYFGVNALAKPFDNLKIRQAFALALNKDEIAHNIYKDEVIATNHIVPNGMPGYNPNLTGPQSYKDTNGNATLAKQLFQQGMQEEGYTSATFPAVTLTTASQGNTDQRNEFAAEQQMWKNVLGVTVKIDDVDFGKLLDERASTVNNPNGMQMYALDWSADYPDPQDWLTLLFDKGSSKNAVNFGQNKTPENAQEVAVQQLMEQADGNGNNTLRMQQYNQAEQQIVNDVAWIPRYQATSSLVRKSCVVGMIDNPQAMTPPDDWGSIYISTATPCGDASPYK